jgi:stress-induced morphogen
MAMAGPDIEALIRAAFPDADVIVTDLAGDGDHFGARVVSQAFAGKSRIQQHQMVYAALKGRMGAELHALALETASPGAARSGLVSLQTNPIDSGAGV